MYLRVAWTVIGLASVLGCSSPASNGGPDGGGGQGGGGSSGGQGGGSSGGQGGSSAGDGGVSDAPAPMACSPGTAITWEHRTVCNWFNYVSPDAGTLSFPASSNVDDPMVNSVPLPVPMTAGQAYAFSVWFRRSGWEGTIELWGTDRSCGPGLQQLLAEPFPPPSTSTLFCTDTIPTAAYTEVLIVYRYSNDPSSGSSTIDPVMACPQGTCP